MLPTEPRREHRSTLANLSHQLLNVDLSDALSKERNDRGSWIKIHYGRGTTNYSGPSWGRTSDQPGRVNSQKTTVQRISNYILPEPCMRLSMHTALQERGLLSRYPLCPFPVYRTLPRSFEYYGHSVTMRLSTFRRSPSSLTHPVCT